MSHPSARDDGDDVDNTLSTAAAHCNFLPNQNVLASYNFPPFEVLNFSN